MRVKNKKIISILLFVCLFSSSCSPQISSADQEQQNGTIAEQNQTEENTETAVGISGWEALEKNPSGDNGDHFAFDSNGNLYTGFSITLADGSNLSTIQKWDGNSWQILGGEFPGHVRAIAISADGIVYSSNIIGEGENEGDIDSAIFKWSNNTWNLIADVNGYVSSLVIDPYGNLYAGGFFSSMAGLNIKNVAKYDGGNWITTNWEDEDLSVRKLVFSPDGLLYAVGENRLNKWDGVLWTPLHFGGDTYETFWYIAVDPVGVLYVTGEFTKDGVYGYYLAKLEQSNWSFIESQYISKEGEGSLPELLGFSNGVLYGLISDVMHPEKEVVFGWRETGEFEIPIGGIIYSITLSPYENAIYGEFSESMVVKMNLTGR